MLLDDIDIDGAQRALDRLPRPPCELPASDPMRGLADLLDDVRASSVDDELHDAQTEIEAIEDQLSWAKSACDDASAGIDAACRAADENRGANDANAAEALDTLIARLEEIASELENAR